MTLFVQPPSLVVKTSGAISVAFSASSPSWRLYCLLSLSRIAAHSRWLELGERDESWPRLNRRRFNVIRFVIVNDLPGSKIELRLDHIESLQFGNDRGATKRAADRDPGPVGLYGSVTVSVAIPSPCQLRIRCDFFAPATVSANVAGS